MFEFRGVHKYPKVISHDAYGYQDDSDLEEIEEVEEEESTAELQVGSDTNTRCVNQCLLPGVASASLALKILKCTGFG